MEQILGVALNSLINIFIGAAVASFVTAAKFFRGNNKAIHEGMSALLWREIKNIHKDAVKHNGMTLEERRQLEYVYSAYSGLGYNGTGERMVKESMSLPIID